LYSLKTEIVAPPLPASHQDVTPPFPVTLPLADYRDASCSRRPSDQCENWPAAAAPASRAPPAAAPADRRRQTLSGGTGEEHVRQGTGQATHVQFRQGKGQAINGPARRQEGQGGHTQAYGGGGDHRTRLPIPNAKATNTCYRRPIPNTRENGKNRWNSIPERRRRHSLFSTAMAMERRSGRVGRSPREKKTREGGGSGVRKAAYFYAQGRSIWQLLEDGELGWETIRDYFFDFSQKIKDGEEK